MKVIPFEEAIIQLRPTSIVKTLEHLLRLCERIDCEKCEHKCSWYLRCEARREWLSSQ